MQFTSASVMQNENSEIDNMETVFFPVVDVILLARIPHDIYDMWRAAMQLCCVGLKPFNVSLMGYDTFCGVFAGIV